VACEEDGVVPVGEDMQQHELSVCRQPQTCGDCTTTSCAVCVSVVRRWQSWWVTCEGQQGREDKGEGEKESRGLTCLSAPASTECCTLPQSSALMHLTSWGLSALSSSVDFWARHLPLESQFLSHSAYWLGRRFWAQLLSSEPPA
jgi:hypothetical protein